MQFSASRVFTEAFQILGSRFGLLVGIWLTFFVAIIALFAAFGGMLMALVTQTSIGPGRNPLAGMGASVILFYLLYFAVIFAQQIALSRASMGRTEDTFAIAIGAGLRGALAMLGVLLIYLIAGIGSGIVLSLMMAGLIAATQSAVVSFLLGLVMLGGFFYLFARLSLVLPIIAIDEARNPFTVIGRAWKLASGNSIKIMLAWGLVLVAAMVLYFVAFLVTIGTPSPGIAPSTGTIFAMIAVMLVLGLSVGLYLVTMTTALYQQLSPSSVELTAETFE